MRASENETGEDERTVDELGETLHDILRESREQTSVIVRVGDRIDRLIDDIHRTIVEGGPPFLPRPDDQEHAR